MADTATADHMTEMESLLESSDREERARAITWWASQDSGLVIDLLLPKAFQGNGTLDSSVIQVFSLMEPKMVERLLDAAFCRLGNLPDNRATLEHNINALAKYTAKVPASLPQYVALLERQPPDPTHRRLVLRYLENLCKQPKHFLRQIDLGPIAKVVTRFRGTPVTWSLRECSDVVRAARRILERCGNTTLFLGDLYAEQLLGDVLAQRDVFCETVPLQRKGAFQDLAYEYCQLGTPQEADEWYAKYTEAFLGLLTECPDSFAPSWLSMAIRISRPNQSSAERAAWQLITSGGIIDQRTGQFKTEKTLSTMLFDHLLRQGSHTAMKVLHQLLQLGITPTQGTCYGFMEFMMKVAGPVFSDRVYRLSMDIGVMWELVCREAAEVLFGKVLVHPRLPNGKVPDLVPVDGAVQTGGRIVRAKLIVECKKSNSASGLNETPSEKYRDYCDDLEVWILEPAPRTRPETNMDGAAVVCAEDLIRRVRPRNKIVADKIARFLSLYRSPFFEVDLFDGCARKFGLPQEIVEESTAIFTLLFQHFSTLGVQRWVDPSWDLHGTTYSPSMELSETPRTRP